ncbi:CD1 precursor [Ovis aries]|uniref:CD1 n=1 Tax=Ovis aries TaxID=9940 RepID=O19036_SHEEP|nr:CD1 precursor [Ovis aries]CAA85361.1 CD1 [Ovis aries]
MLLLPLLLLGVILPGGDNEDVFQGPTSFHLKQISTFVNSTWAQNQGSGWLDDLKIHGWESDSGTAIFLKPWSKGNFTDEEMTELEDIFRAYFIFFTQEVQDRVNEFQLEYPFVIQVTAGCELHSGEAIESSLRGALGGLDVWRIQNHSCAPAPDSGNGGQNFCALMTQYQGISDILERLLSETCPRYLLGVLDAGKAELQRQGHPTSIGLILVAIIVPSLILLICLALWFWRRWSHRNIL